MPPEKKGDPCYDRDALESLSDGYVGCGPLAPLKIREVVASHSEALAGCWDGVDLATAQQKVVLRWTITQSGKAAEVVLEKAADAPAVAACLIDRIGELVFPAPLGGGTVTVTFPLTFAE